VSARGIPEATIFHDPASGFYGYRVRFPGRKVHYSLDTCLTYQDALMSCDPHRERVWEESSDADETALLVSRDYREGTVGWNMTRLTLPGR